MKRETELQIGWAVAQAQLLHQFRVWLDQAGQSNISVNALSRYKMTEKIPILIAER